MKNKFGFTLVEMIISITISMIVMGAIGVIVSGGIKGVLTQERSLENSDIFYSFYNELQGAFSNIDTSVKDVKTSSGLIIKQYGNFDKGGFSFIGESVFPELYCKTDPDVSDINVNTKHLYLKTFIPFEEIDEDLFKNGDYNKIFSGTTTGYISDTLNHIIKKIDGTILVGKGVFGSKLIEGGTGTLVYLNNPTGLALSGSILFISDTLNNRILAYDTIGKTVTTLLDINDGIYEPTGLLYEDGILYISNSGKNEVLKYHSKGYDTDTLDVSFEIGTGIVDLKKLEVSFFDGVSDIEPIDNSNNDKNEFTIKAGTNDLKNSGGDYLTGTSDKISYWFSDFGHQISSNPNTDCSTSYTKYYEENNKIVKEYINCGTSTGTLVKKDSSSYNNLNKGDTIKLTITNISGTFSTGNIYTKVELIGDASYDEYFPFKIVGDNDLMTKDDNILEVFTGGINYPTGIGKKGSYILINSFLDRKQYKFNLDATTKTTNITLNNFDFSKLLYDKSRDYRLEIPIDKIELDYTDRLLNFSGSYYKIYNCYNLEENIKRNFLLKKSFK